MKNKWKKKWLKKGFLYTLLIGLLFSPFSFALKKVNAQTFTDTITEHGQNTEDFVFYRHLTTPSMAKSHRITVIHRDSDGHFVYCIQPGSPVVTGSPYTGYTEDLKTITGMSAEQWERVQLLAYYGYQYKDDQYDHTDLKWYSVTQLMIWNSVPSDYEIYFSKSLKNERIDKYLDEIAEMESILAKHHEGVSFAQSVVSLVKGETKVLTDTNNVLKYYKVEESDNVEATISGNTLTLKAKEEGTFRVKLTREDTKYNAPPIAYINPESQNVMMVGSHDPVINLLMGNTQTGELELRKFDSVTNSCQSQKNSSLSGSVYKLYKENGEFVQDLTIGSDCTARATGLSLGRYYVLESKAGTHYELDTEKHYFTISKDASNANLTVYDVPMLGEVSLKKYDSKTNSCQAQGAATLTGAVYGVYDENNTLVTRLTIGSDCTAKSAKNLTIGNYYLQEITAPRGYRKNLSKYSFQITENNYKSAFEITVTDDVYTSTLVINKTYLVENGVKAEVGATFDIISKTTGKVVATITIDESATGSVELPYDNYIVRQTKGQSGYKFSDDIDFSVNENSKEKEYITLMNSPYTAKVKVKKVDSTGKSIPMKGIHFKIFDVTNNKYVCQTIAYPNQMTICEFETDDNGEFITPKELYPGKYRLEEVDQMLDGYLWNSEGLEFMIDENSEIIKDKDLGEILNLSFENQEVTGKIEIHKTGEQFVMQDGNFHYEEIPLPNIEFGVYDLEGNLVATLKTNSDGYASIENLKLGTYILKELNTETNYVLDGTEYEVNLEYIDQYTPVVTKEFYLKNYLKKGILEFSKLDFSTQEPIPNTKMEIYTEDGELVYQGSTDEDGKIIIPELFVGKYYIVEVETADPSYLLNEEKMYFEVKENGDIVKSIMCNKKKTGTLEFKKTDFVNDEPLPNTKIRIENEKGETVFEGVTDENGSIIIHELVYGKYCLFETEAPESYALNENPMCFEIKEDGEIVKVEMKDKKIHSKVKLHKVDEKNNAIAGVTIGVYDKDGNLLGSYVTDENGDIEVELEYGSYYFQEIATLDHYILSDEKVYFDVTLDGEVIQKTLINESEEIEVPNTLSNDYWFLIPVSFIVVSLALLYKSTREEKNKKVKINHKKEGRK